MSAQLDGRGLEPARLRDEDLEAVAAIAEPGADPSEASAPLVIVDGSNAVHAVAVSGRAHARARAPEARARLTGIVQAAFPDERTIVVFDDRSPAPDPPSGTLEVVHADDADEWIVARAAAHESPSRVVVITSDRGLTRRLATLGVATKRPTTALAHPGGPR